MKWDNSSPQSYIKFVPVKKVDGSYTAADSGTFKAIVGLECRGLEITKWIPGADFSGESLGGKVFDSVDLSEGDWTEYDDDADLSLSVLELRHEITRG